MNDVLNQDTLSSTIQPLVNPHFVGAMAISPVGATSPVGTVSWGKVAPKLSVISEMEAVIHRPRAGRQDRTQLIAIGLRGRPHVADPVSDVLDGRRAG